jgi:serine/threonine protein kinase
VEVIKPEPEVKNRKSKVVKPKRILGTADYMAPEVIEGKEHTFALDFWSLGVIAYEFLTGGLPFHDETPEKVFKKILAKDLTYPPVGTEEGMLSPEAFDFMDKLMTLDPKKRLGYKSIDEIKNHPFFNGIVWEKLMEGAAPFIPGGKDIDTE